MKENNLKFKVSSALKSIIGKDLITNKYIAIFELVKNSFDAYSEKSELVFEKNKIVIKDDGKGMNLDEIKNKWLFVAYSAKADDTEDVDYLDYRKKINQRRAFAGAKGVGRFACDRLGKKLTLTSIKEGSGSKIESIEVFWESFEENPKDNFIDIEVKHNTLKSNPYPDMKHGTVLEINDLRESWTEEDIERLKKHLAKLINPVKNNVKDNFDILISHKGKQEKVENFIFDKLTLKTTQIVVQVSKDGKFITTEIVDRGSKIYKIKEKNQWSKSLSNTEIQLFFLSTPTKIMFSHLMGVQPVQFGSVFLYKNGFRVFPFGEQDDDSLGLDRRKQQGYARNLGTRELIGFIAIDSKTDDFKETSSRDGGLIETQAYIDLKEFFIQKALRRLESYVVDTLDWTYIAKTGVETFPDKKKSEIKELIKRLTQTSDFVEIDYSYALPEKIKEKAESGFQGATEQLTQEAKKTGDAKLLKAVKNIQEIQKNQKKVIKQISHQKEMAENRASALMKVTKQEFSNLVSYHHQIGISALMINEYISIIFKKIKADDTSDLEKYIQKIKLENDKITSISRFASGSGMKENAVKKVRALSSFIVDYLNDYKTIASGGIDIKMNTNGNDFSTRFAPFDIGIVIDNLISNSRKAKAKNITVSISCNSDSLDFIFEDDGMGLDKDFKLNPSTIFDAKVSSTNGAGWGLHHVKEILNSLNATIKVVPKDKGLKFVVVFKKS